MFEKRKFVCADSINNNNKFWEFSYDTDTSMLTVKFGRIGSTCQTDTKTCSRKELDKKIADKLKARGKEGTATYKPPYREIEIIADAIQKGPTGPSMSKELVLEAAKKQLVNGNSELSKLIERLVEANRHELIRASGGQMDIDLKTGIISTPVGVVTKKTIEDARKILDEMAPLINAKTFDDQKFISCLNQYLMLVPQHVHHARGWHKLFFAAHNNTVDKQSTLLDQLEASADLADARMKAANDTNIQTTLADTPNLFNAELKIVTDVDVIKKIEKMFFESINDKHTSKNMKPVKIYEVELPDMKSAWDKDGAKIHNIQMLWHGTRMFNVLSILKSGFMLPKTLSTMQIAGAMFGHGIYSSDQSTKALNYATGYWHGGAKDTNCFMFLVDVALGTQYIPKSSYESLPKPGFDSTFAKPGISGILNNEFVVYRTSQTNIRYLIEFE